MRDELKKISQIKKLREISRENVMTFDQEGNLTGEEITKTEVEKALRHMKNSKSPGNDDTTIALMEDDCRKTNIFPFLRTWEMLKKMTGESY